MKMRIASLLGLLLLAAAPAALAQATQPIISVAMTEVKVSGGLQFGSNPDAPAGYAVNGGYGPYGTTITMSALATGTFPSGLYSYVFYINGVSIGSPAPEPNDGSPASVAWTPPQPGVYYLSVTASDGAHNAQSLAVEYFATGITIVSPVTNTELPIGSSVVIQAAAAINAGAVSKVEFYADGVAIGSATNYPYSIIYTPPTSEVVGTVHFLRADSYLADGVTVASSSPLVSVISIAPVLPLPVVSIGSPSQTTPPTTIPIPDYVADASAFIPVSVNASAPSGTIEKVELYINGVLYATDSALPYNFSWSPTVSGTYTLTALAYDEKDNVIASTTSTSPTLTPAPTTVIVGQLPSVVITSPGNGSTISGLTSFTVNATDSNVDINGNPIAIKTVNFYQDGNIVGSAGGVPGQSIYTISFTPTQKIDPTTGDVLPSTLTAIASDVLGFSGTATGITVTVTNGGSSGGVSVGIPPTVSVTGPSTLSSVPVNTPVTLSAVANAPNGNVKQITFDVDGIPIGTVSAYPYSFAWTPTNLGFYTITAEVYDNLGDTTNSSPITLYVVAPPTPTVSITSPTSGGILTVGTPVTITAAASSPTQTVAQVAFYENGILIGTSKTPPYSISFTPLATGIYTLTAIATDSSGQTTTSSSTSVEAAPSTSGVNTVSYTGNSLGLTAASGGTFGFIVSDGTTGAYIGIPTAGSGQSVTFTPDLAISSTGTFASTPISGTATSTGVNGTLQGGAYYIGTPTATGTTAVASGYYTGSLGGQPNSQVAAIVGADGSIYIYVANGTYKDGGYTLSGAIAANGAFSLTTYGGQTISGTVNPTTSLLTGSVTGPSGGNIIAGKVSGGTFSDGVMKSISTRGYVGTGGNALIGGFVVGGTAAKQLMIRAAGPALTGLGVTGAISAPQLQIYSGSSLVASNAGWSSTTTNAAQVGTAELAAGAFPFASGSTDSAVVGSFAPGAYTAMITGVGGVTGTSLVEVYDLDAYSPFTANKLIDISTRGLVGTNGSVLIAGVTINGTAPKKLLIRGAGPGLASLGVTGALATPHLQLYNSAQVVIRENYSWQVGNDPGLVQAAEASTAAFAFANGSADSAIVIVLNPGTYTVEVSGVGTAAGVALVEVYEIP